MICTAQSARHHTRARASRRANRLKDGLKRVVVDAVMQRDYPVIQGVILVVAGVYVLLNLLIDLTYSLLDPRIRY